jgi:hypothetical protein
MEVKIESSTQELFDSSPISSWLNRPQNRLLDSTPLISGSSHLTKGIATSQSIVVLIDTCKMNFILVVASAYDPIQYVSFVLGLTSPRAVLHNPKPANHPFG